MSHNPLDALLSTLFSRGYITLSDWPARQFQYDEQTWLEVARFFEDQPRQLADKYTLLYEGILTDDDGEQFSESEATEFLLKCAFGREHLHTKLLNYCERYVRENCEERLRASLGSRA